MDRMFQRGAPMPIVKPVEREHEAARIRARIEENVHWTPMAEISDGCREAKPEGIADIGCACT